MSGLEIGGIVLAIFPLIITAVEKILAHEHSFRLWDERACRIELEAIHLEIQIQEALFQNSYLKLCLSFMGQEELVKITADPNGIRENSAEISSKMKSRLGDQWNLYQAVMRRLENTMLALKASIELVGS